LKNIVFTLCSNNYLAQAKTLGDSVLKHNTDIVFVIGLVDRHNDEVDYSKYSNFIVIKFEDLPFEELHRLIGKYSIVEINTAAKPFYFRYLFTEYNAHQIIYLDPDIKLYHGLNEVISYFNNYDFLVTPHTLSPIQINGKTLDESRFLKFGIFNLGFFGLKKSDLVFNFLDWWSERLIIYGKYDINKGTYVDQKWINFLPVYYEDHFKIIRYPGCNTAFWNLHERHISINSDNKYIVNDQFPLVFYHFSQFDISLENIAKNQNRHHFSENPILLKLFEEYISELYANDYIRLKDERCTYNRMYLQYIISDSSKLDRALFKLSPKSLVALLRKIGTKFNNIKRLQDANSKLGDYL
jgi:glycosyl transferase family 8